MYFSTEGYKTAEIHAKVEEIRVIMLDNIRTRSPLLLLGYFLIFIMPIMFCCVDKAFKRGDNLADIESKAQELHESTPIFSRAAEKLKKKKWRQNKNVTIALAMCLACICCCVCVAMVYFILAMACGGIALNNCVLASLQGGGGGGGGRSYLEGEGW